MAAYVNNATFVVHVAGVMLVPGVVTEVPADAERRVRFKALVDGKTLSKVTKAEAKTDQSPPGA